MEPTLNTIDQLREQEEDLCKQIAGLEETVSASSTSGIREFRLTRLRQLQSLHDELSQRLDRLEASSESALDNHVLGTAFREASLVVQTTFRA